MNKESGRHIRWITAASMIVLFAHGDAAGQGPEKASKPLEVNVKTVSEESIRGVLLGLSLSHGAVVRVDAHPERRISVADLVRISMPVSVIGRTLRDWTMHLVGGDVVYGRVAGRDEDAVVLETTDLGNLTIPLEAILRFSAPLAHASVQQESFEWFDRNGAGREDRVLLANGDVAQGFITGMDSNGVSIDLATGETKIPERLVVAGRFAPSPPPKVTAPHMILLLRNSGRITATDLKWAGRAIEARTRFGQRVRLEAERVVRVDMVGGRWEWLSSHRPISEEHTPMLSLPWEVVFDRNVLGGPMTVAGESFEHGIGVHSRSILTFDLKGAYTEFVTHFGIDDDSGPYADVTVQIRVDGQPRFEQADLQRGKLHGPVRLDVTSAKHIELIVGYGENGDLQDRLNWVEPALIR